MGTIRRPPALHSRPDRSNEDRKLSRQGRGWCAGALPFLPLPEKGLGAGPASHSQGNQSTSDGPRLSCTPIATRGASSRSFNAILRSSALHIEEKPGEIAKHLQSLDGRVQPVLRTDLLVDVVPCELIPKSMVGHEDRGAEGNGGEGGWPVDAF